MRRLLRQRWLPAVASLFVSTALLAFGERVARADNPLNSSDKTSAKEPQEPQPHTEVNIVPVVGGNSDIGVGGGAFGAITRLKKGYDPFLWNLEASLMVTFKPAPDGGKVVLPYQDAYAKLTVVRPFGTPLRFEIRPSYTEESTLGYYGLGNASSDAMPPGRDARYFEYDRVHPSLDTLLRFRIVDHLAGKVGFRYTYNRVTIDSTSRLADDARSNDPELQGLLDVVPNHSVALFQYGVQWDTRDEETSSHRGTFHELGFKVSPGGTESFPYRYTQTNLTLRGFVPLAGPRVVLAGRFVGDLLVGNPPFYELAKYEDAYALGGVNGVRGVPAQRYSGKVKTFGNIELRTEVTTFHALKKKLTFGITGFFDAGRVWADTRSEPALDGTSVGIKYGAGGGLRLQSGSAFVLRLDVAWSPDAKPVAGYLGAGQMF